MDTTRNTGEHGDHGDHREKMKKSKQEKENKTGLSPSRSSLFPVSIALSPCSFGVWLRPEVARRASAPSAVDLPLVPENRGGPQRVGCGRWVVLRPLPRTCLEPLIDGAFAVLTFG